MAVKVVSEIAQWETVADFTQINKEGVSVKEILERIKNHQKLNSSKSQNKGFFGFGILI